MRTVELSSILATSLERAWAELQTSRLLKYVSRGRMSFRAIDPPQLPEQWSPGEYKVSLRAFGFVPIGWQVIGIEHPPHSPGKRSIRDNGYSAMISKWDHLVTLEALDEARTRYTDRVDIEAGALTGAVAAFARSFYAHRQRRWARLVANDFDYSR